MIIVEVGIGILLFVSGYTLGRVNLLQKFISTSNEIQYQGKPKRDTGWKQSSQNQHEISEVVSIDETKFVTEVSTDSFAGEHAEIGNKTVAKDKVSSSVSKLKNLKTNK